MNLHINKSLLLLAGAVALLSAPALRSQTLTFDVNINTAGLSAEAADAPFYLDFQLLYGNSALASNTATLSNFVLTSGSASGSAVTSGSATGSLASSVVLTANSTHTDSELYQQFSSGTTNINFKAVVTETGPDVGTPTEFAAAIFDSAGGSIAPLYTTASDGQSLVTLNLSSSNTLAAVQAFSATNSSDDTIALTGVAATISAIPEPSTTAALLGAAALVFAFCSRRLGLLRA